MDQIVVTLESLIEEVESALEYGKSLGYAECLSHTMQGKPASDDPEKAIKHYIKQLIEDYTED